MTAPGRLALAGLGSALAVLAALAACTAEADRDWGPLAVVDDSDSTGGGMEGLFGILRIREDCVTVETDQDTEVTLVWPGSAVEWDESARTIRFEGAGGAVELRNGTEVTMGGGESTGDDYLSPPADGCPATQFRVSDVQVG